MPHIHGVAWILQSYLDEKGFKDGFLCDKKNSKATAELADRLISCQFPNIEVEEEDTNKHPRLGKIVRQTQIHWHTPSCLKYNGICRYHFPRIPCTETVVARPFDEQEDLKSKYNTDEKKKEFKEKAKATHRVGTGRRHCVGRLEVR